MIDKQEYKVRFYTQENGKSEIFEFLNGLNDKEQAKFLGQVVYLKENGANVPRPYADTLRDGIHELRLKLSGDQIRVLYFFCYRNYIILTHSFVKHTIKVPENEIEKAITIRNDFLHRYTTTEKIEMAKIKGV